MDIVLFGIQGSGKGTQAKKLQEKFGYKLFETGSELRKIAQQQNELGFKIKQILEQGNLVPTEVVIEILENFIKHLHPNDKAIYDGIPRNTDQQQQFDLLVKKYNRQIACLEITLPIEETIKRLLARGRHDDTESAINQRIHNFKLQTQPILESYKQNNNFITINGFQPIDSVTQEIESKLAAL